MFHRAKSAFGPMGTRDEIFRFPCKHGIFKIYGKIPCLHGNPTSKAQIAKSGFFAARLDSSCSSENVVKSGTYATANSDSSVAGAVAVCARTCKAKAIALSTKQKFCALIRSAPACAASPASLAFRAKPWRRGSKKVPDLARTGSDSGPSPRRRRAGAGRDLEFHPAPQK